MLYKKLVHPAYILLLVLALGIVTAVYFYGHIRAAFIVHRIEGVLSPELAEKNLSWGDQVYLRIFKEEKHLEVWLLREEKFELFTTYDICDYSGQLGPKLRPGDRQSPEGFYQVTSDMMNPRSSYHLSFNLGFPNEYDRAHGREGSFLMVHGNCVSVGCYAITDENIEKVYSLMEAAFDAGQKTVHVHIFPFRMTQENLKRHENSAWRTFWEELKPLHDIFEKDKTIPSILVTPDKRYSLVKS